MGRPNPVAMERVTDALLERRLSARHFSVLWPILTIHIVNILMINNRYPPETLGGAEVVVAGLCDALTALGHEVHVLAATAAHSLPIDEHHRGVTVRRLYPGGSIFPPPACGVLRRLVVQLRAHLMDLYNPVALRATTDMIRTVQPDVIHTHNLYGLSTALWSVVAKGGRPLVHTAHDSYLLAPRHNLRSNIAGRDPLSALYRLVYRQALDHVDTFCCPSRDLLNRHRALGCRPRTAEVIPNGIVSPSPSPQHSGTEPADRAIRALFLGRLDTHKGIPTLIQAARLLAGDARIRFEIAGAGPLEALVRHAALELPHVMFHAYVTDAAKARLFQDGSVLLVPSTCPESFGLVIAEALAYGLPAIVTDLGGQAEQVRETGAGLTVPPGDARALADRLRELADDANQRATLEARAREHASRYTTERMAHAYLNVYRTVIPANSWCAPGDSRKTA